MTQILVILVILVLVVGGCGSPDAAKSPITTSGSTPSVNPASNNSTVGSPADSANEQPPKEIALDLGGGVNLELVLIPAGKFTMGSPEDENARGTDEKQHEVIISQPFYMGKYEVTQKQYETVMGAKANVSVYKGADLPVDNVSWDRAQGFCKKAGELTKKIVQLPTEAQWEYACRAGTTTEFNTGQGEDALEKAGWCLKNSARSGGTTIPVGKRQPNAWGLYDMHGNVWEWCKDWFGLGDWPAGVLTDPTGKVREESTGDRVWRGGSWQSIPWACRSANRDRGEPDVGYSTVGFRVCVPASSTPDSRKQAE